jgi:hypothetical protein
MRIAYDLPLLNFIPQLDATGHVSHVQHRKTHVTLHHNGGRLSHSGVLSVWQVRPASAHFNIDAAGTAAQFVRITEYAWATGSTEGNQRSISIEMCNESLGPDWLVGTATWYAAGRLAGWIFARVIGYRPTRDFLVQHKSWSSTLCAGPYIDKVYANILSVAQHYYDVFTGAIQEEVDVDNYTADDRIQGQEIWAVTDAMSQGLSKRRIHVRPDSPELLQVKHWYEVQHNLRNFLALTPRKDYEQDPSQGPMPAPGEDFPIVTLLKKMDQSLTSLNERVAAIESKLNGA